MSETILQMSTSQRLEPFLILSKSVKGVANNKLIQDVLAATGVYVFAELLESPNLIEASSIPEVAPYYTLLKIFSYGTYRDYVAYLVLVDHANELPALNEAQITKLKHLSIVSLSEESRTISYDKLLKYLDIADVRQLEDLIIGAFYEDVLKGKMDQKRKQLEVEYTMGRDLRPGQRGDVITILQNWSQNTENILNNLDKKISSIQDTAAEEKRSREQYEREIERLKKEIKSNAAINMDDEKGKGRRPNNNGMYDDGETTTYNSSAIQYDSKEYIEESYRTARTRKSRGSKRYALGRP
ncbi:hypothetical protein NQZ79_g7905 [Umbelopsis isabellina]|nr:hypothetical protein NQZ79_g7905 [Umbelopsis isabellina]